MAEALTRCHNGRVSRDRALALIVILGQVVFIAGWLVGGLIEGDGYSAMRHEISDLGAVTATHPWLARTTLLIGGLSTAAFGLVVIRSELGALAGWLVALSLLGLDGIGDFFFHVDCRRVDGCSSTEATDSWHGMLHLAVFAVSAIATIAAPFVLSRQMRGRAGWTELAWPTRVFGFLVILALVVTLVTSESSVGGLTQRLAATLVVLGLVALAQHVIRLERAEAPALDTT